MEHVTQPTPMPGMPWSAPCPPPWSFLRDEAAGEAALPRMGREAQRLRTREDLVAILETDRTVREIILSPDPVAFRDGPGRRKRYAFELLVTMVTGWRVAVAVETGSRARQPGTARLIETVGRVAGTRFADSYVLLTENDVCPVRAFNARLVRDARLARDERAVAILAGSVARLATAMEIGALLDASGAGPRGYKSVVCLVDDGVLDVLTPGRISLRTLVRPAGKIRHREWDRHGSAAAGMRPRHGGSGTGSVHRAGTR